MTHISTASAIRSTARARTNKFFAFLTGLSKAARRASRRTSSIVYSIKLLPSGGEHHAWYCRQPRIFIFNTYAHPCASRKVYVRFVARREKHFPFYSKKHGTYSHTRIYIYTPWAVGGARCSDRAACYHYMFAHKASRYHHTLGFRIKVRNRTEHGIKLVPLLRELVGSILPYRTRDTTRARQFPAALSDHPGA